MELKFVSGSRGNDHKVEVSLDKEDIKDAQEIVRMMEERCCPKCGESLDDGWTVLIKYWTMARESIIEKIKKVSASEQDIRLSSIRAAILKGFDECFAIPMRVVNRAQEYLETHKENANEEYDGE